jgi:O-antigen ligase
VIGARPKASGWWAVSALPLLFAPLLYSNPTIVLVLVGMAMFGIGLVIRPSLSLLVLLAAPMVSDGIDFAPNIGIILSVGKLAVGGVLAIWLLRCALTGQPPLESNTHFVPYVVIVLVLTLGLPRNDFATLNNLASVIGFVLLGLLAQLVFAVSDPKELRLILPLLSAGYALVLLVGMTFGDIHEGYDHDRQAGFGGIATEWAFSLVLGVGPCVAFLQHSRSRFVQVASPLLLVIAVIAVIASVTRAAILVLIITSPFLLWILRRERGVLSISAIAGAIAIPMFVNLDGVQNRMSSLVDPADFELDGSIRDRAIAAEHGWRLFVEYPFLGVGTGAFPNELQIAAGGQVMIVPHNAYLGLAAEQGAIGFLIVLASYSYFGVLIVQTFLRQTSPRFRLVTWGLAAMLVTFAFYAFVFDALNFAPAHFWLGIILVWHRVAQLPQEQLEKFDLV